MLQMPLPTGKQYRLLLSHLPGPDFDGNSPLLKALSIQVIGHGESKLVLTWKLLPCWLDFIAPEGAVQVAGAVAGTIIKSVISLWML